MDSRTTRYSEHLLAVAVPGGGWSSEELSRRGRERGDPLLLLLEPEAAHVRQLLMDELVRHPLRVIASGVCCWTYC